MRISTKGRYGLRAMVDIAENSAKGHVTLTSIAERQDVSQSYLEQVFSALRKAALVKSVKGAQGGYFLADDASRITAAQVLKALEGNLSVTDGEDTHEDMANSMQYCIAKNVWDKIDERIENILEDITIEDLVNKHRSIRGNLPLMYYI